jgi:hypothetical protein
VLKVLTDAYGEGVKAGTKAILVPAGGSRRKADVIVALEYRRYLQFYGLNDQNYVEGIIFYTSSNQEIINYPKPHSTNLTRKHQRTSSWFKPMVRILKNLRRRLVKMGTWRRAALPPITWRGCCTTSPTRCSAPAMPTSCFRP